MNKEEDYIAFAVRITNTESVFAIFPFILFRLLIYTHKRSVHLHIDQMTVVECVRVCNQTNRARKRTKQRSKMIVYVYPMQQPCVFDTFAVRVRVLCFFCLSPEKICKIS